MTPAAISRRTGRNRLVRDGDAGEHGSHAERRRIGDETSVGQEAVLAAKGAAQRDAKPDYKTTCTGDQW
jgi:hypothetical protein